MAEETARTGSIYGGIAEPCAIVFLELPETWRNAK